jgi:protein TonB
MVNQKKSHDLTRQNEIYVKKSQKHDSNLQKNSTLYFQVGLIVCLLFSYGLLEMKFESNVYDVGEVIYHNPDDYLINVNPIVEQPDVDQSVEKTIPKRLIDHYKTKPDDSKAKATEEVVVDPTTKKVPVAIIDIPYVKPPTDAVDIPLDFVEVVPVYPGCEKASTNEDRKACMSKKIAKHIQKKFDTDIANELGLEGIQKINVMFKIDQNGNVVDIRARSIHKALEKEAKDVISKLPQMTPGKQLNKNVSVIYGIPIYVSIDNY